MNLWVAKREFNRWHVLCWRFLYGRFCAALLYALASHAGFPRNSPTFLRCLLYDRWHLERLQQLQHMGWQRFNSRRFSRLGSGGTGRGVVRRSRLWRLITLGLTMFGLAVLLPSCQTVVTSIENSPLAQLRLENFRTAEAADKTQLIRSVIGEPKTFNYFLAQESSSTEALSPVFEGLISIDYSGGESKIVPALAESWVVADDGKTITYTLKENLKWSDGEPLTVDDVVFTYNDLILNPAVPTDTRDILRVGEEGKLPQVRKLDARRVEFKIPEPFAPFLRVTGIAIMPKHILEETVTTKGTDGQLKYLSTWDTGTDPRTIIGSGPYRFKQFMPGERLVFERNPHYWAKGPNGESLPRIEEMVWPVVADQDAQFVRFRSGDVDVLSVTPDNFSLIKRSEEIGNYTLYNGGPTTTRLFLTFNLNKGSIDGMPVVDPMKSAWFNDVRFRQAVAYAIDRDTMLNNIFKGLGELQNSQIAPQSPYFADSGLPVYDYNIEKAKELLLSAGFEYQGDRLVDSSGNPVRFTLRTNAGNEIRESAGAQIKQNLAQLGITVDFQPIDFNKLVTDMDTSLAWEAIVLGFGAGEEPNSSANLWLADGGLHFFNQQPLSQPPLPGREVYDWEQKISDLYIKAATELDEEKRKALYFETQKLVQENLPFIHLVGQYSMAAVRNKIENVDYSAIGGLLWNLEELKITEN